jgi:glycosyltransferase involved in cell wall biosynthesis
MLDSLPAAGIDPLVICPADSRIIPWCEANRVPFRTCELAFRDKWHPFRWWRSVRSIRAVLRAEKVSLVHSNQLYSYPAAGVAAHDLGLPRVCHFRDEANTDLIRWCCPRGLDFALCISRYIEQHIATNWPSDRPRPSFTSLINPVRLPPLGDEAEQRQARSASRRPFGLMDEEIVFGFIGQIVPVKGLLQLLEALAGLAHRPGWRLLVAGRDPHPGAVHEHECQTRVSELGLADRVRFVGFLDDVAPFYQAIDLAVVPSLVEPLGRIPLEAASYARPSVAYAVGGLPETIQHGESGWLVPTGDVPALRQTLVNFLDPSGREMGARARVWVERVSDPRSYANRLVEIYDKVLYPVNSSQRGQDKVVSGTE